MGRVKGRQRNSDGQVIGVANRNPVLDTRVYAIEFPDGKVGEYAANVIAENTFSLADPDGNQMLLLEAIVAHRKDGHAVEKADVFVFKNAQRSIRKTTEGWQLCVEWKNGSATRERLADVKESHPVEVAENAVLAHDIQDKPAFAWWVPATIEIRNRIIAAVKLQIPRTNEKFGIQIRRSWAEAVKLDMDNGDDQWQKAIRDKMAKVRKAFKVLSDDDKVPPGYQQILCHMIFVLMIENFRRKARLVAGAHMTDTPSVMTYSSVVSRELV